MANYIVELFKSSEENIPQIYNRVKGVTGIEYNSLEEVMTAIKCVGFMHVPFLEDALKWRSKKDESKLQIEILEWPIYENACLTYFGKIRAVQ